MPSISVLMSLYEKESEKFLEECLLSLEKQTRPADEVVVVFDGFIPEDLANLVLDLRKSSISNWLN
ncbi:hypothetical protein JCM19236_5055 [Vibrio sp. JCM 19236]|nr:hypothetical protein JCM19236_5055 [Vibrio sp. JCM 19236]